ncbi:ABC transporter permease [Congregicoccus parvus]|uniref:ABC transporter permease n=1 Tax=Congregicoccus parvus TaxID=3081749 RepID=UPI003FA5E3AD
MPPTLTPMTSRARTVFIKELRETFRDRRVLLGVIVSPLLVTPLLLLAMGFFVGQKVQSDRTETLVVAVVGAGALPGWESIAAGADTLEVLTLATPAEAEAAVRDRSVRAALVVPDDAANTLADGGNVRAELLFDGASDKSRNALSRLEGLLREIGRTEVTRRLAAQGLERSILEPIAQQSRDLAQKEKTGGFLLGMILPYIVILSASFGGMTSAFDLAAGEKERGTMETLLVSPASRHEIILGKLGTIAVVSVCAAFCAIAGLVAAVHGGFAMASHLLDAGLAVSYPAVGAMLLLVIPLALMTSALLLVVSTFARNQKEAQAYVFPFMILVMLPAILSSVLGPENALGLAFVPILNTALAMKQVLAGSTNLLFLVSAIASSALYAALAMRLSVRMFERENILFRT